jgi:hypothetical protein
MAFVSVDLYSAVTNYRQLALCRSVYSVKGYLVVPFKKHETLNIWEDYNRSNKPAMCHKNIPTVSGMALATGE